MKTIAALAFFVASAAILPDADAQNVSIRIDTPEIGLRIGAPVGYGVVGYPAAVYPAPVYRAPVYPAPIYAPPVYPVPVYVPPPRVIVAPAPVYYYPYSHARPHPPGHHRKPKGHYRYGSRYGH